MQVILDVDVTQHLEKHPGGSRTTTGLQPITRFLQASPQLNTNAAAFAKGGSIAMNAGGVTNVHVTVLDDSPVPGSGNPPQAVAPKVRVVAAGLG